MMLPDGAPETGRKGPEAGGQQQETLPGQKNAGEKQQERNQDAGAAPAAGQGQQESGLPPKKNGKGGRAVRRKLLYAAAVVVLLVLVGVKLGFGRGTEQTGETTLTAVQAQRGDIAVSVSGSGTVQPIEQYDVSSLVSGDILEDYVTLGAQVEAGDLLYVIDSSSAENSIKKARIQAGAAAAFLPAGAGIHCGADRARPHRRRHFQPVCAGGGQREQWRPAG